MKPQDLRIGNYVRIKDNGEIVRVEAITKRKIGFHYGKNETRMYYRKYSEIESVLIYDVRDRLPHIDGLEWADKAAFKGIYIYQGVLLVDLHHLQNIHYAITGNEIEIEI